MGLDEYFRKRDFRRTPEPRGREHGEGSGFSFCVQKHAASRLHYDFRLELDGVLKSWAVPKGPAYDPAEKRLAMQTEDHPLEYGDFEGVIPEGQYGGGTVLLWDRGRWEPVKDAQDGYARGRLKFRLFGEKLQGGWTLVRIKGRDPRERGRSWLLIKERDETARPIASYDVTEARPQSVATGRDMEQIARDRDRVWESRGAEEEPASRKGRPRSAATERAGALPEFVPPQLATLVAEAPAGEEWLHEIKYDGYRILCRVEGGEARLASRNGKDWTAALPSLAQAAARLPCRRALLDGEAAVLLTDGTTSFNALQNTMAEGSPERLVYFAFDLLHLDGQDLTGAPLEERKAALAALLGRAGPAADPIRYSDHVLGAGARFFEQACRMRLEGIVSKRREAPYRGGRGRDWLKVKCVREQEFVIGGFTDPEGRRAGVGALLLGVYEEDALRFAGKVGTGFTDHVARTLRRRLEALEVDEPPFSPRPGRMKGAHWVRPELVAEVRFAEWTPEGRLRHPSFQGLREDKPARSIVREQPQAVPGPARRQAPVVKRRVRAALAAARPGPASRARAVATLAGVRITHPDRMLYPAEGITKLKLAEFYEAIAEWILPHVRGRPTTLVRCPKGLAEPCFYQKHVATWAPEALRRVEIQEKKKVGEYLVVDDLPGLVGLVQIGILEIHTWNSTAERLEQPDRIVFDLDPAPDVPWARVVAAARLVREELRADGLSSFVKTTGGKGLHVVVPLAAGPGWGACLEYARALSDRIAAQRPREFLTEMSKARRVGRIYIDYLRNQRGATSVAAYSTRARAGAPVSTPLHWDELEARLRPERFTVASLRRRLKALRQDPWRGYDTLAQRVPAG